MTDKLTALVGYLNRRSAEAAYGHPHYWLNHLLPPVPSQVTAADVDAFAAYLLQDAELRAINLGTWLGTTEGQIFVTAVERALPPVYQPYAQLFVAALRRAAELQHEGKQVEARPWLAVAAAVTVVLAVLGWAALSSSGG